MASSNKNSHRIVVRGVEYRWRAKGDDGSIAVTIWPAEGGGGRISCRFRYHETWVSTGDGCKSSLGDQIVVTNRLVRRVIEHALDAECYDPDVSGRQLAIETVEDKIDWSDAVRARSHER